MSCVLRTRAECDVTRGVRCFLSMRGGISPNAPNSQERKKKETCNPKSLNKDCQDWEYSSRRDDLSSSRLQSIRGTTEGIDILS